jgi:hypothetical protein
MSNYSFPVPATTHSSNITMLLLLLLISTISLPTADAFGLLERFRVTCPADPSSIRLLEPSLIDDNNNNNGDTGNDDCKGGATWVAVYRSNQNKPMVLNNRDEFLNAMKIATTEEEEEDSQQQQQQQYAEQSWSKMLETPMALEKPVAVAQLRPSTDYDDKYVLDSLRCGLKKE